MVRKCFMKVDFQSCLQVFVHHQWSPQSFEEGVPCVLFCSFVLPCVKYSKVAGSRLLCWNVCFNTTDVSKIQPQFYCHFLPFSRNLCSNSVHKIT